VAEQKGVVTTESEEDSSKEIEEGLAIKKKCQKEQSPPQVKPVEGNAIVTPDSSKHRTKQLNFGALANIVRKVVGKLIGQKQDDRGS
jgi:hypothetical protein